MPCVRVGIISGVFIKRPKFFYYKLPVCDFSGMENGVAES